MNIRLCSGDEILNADRKLIRFVQSEYELYDGVVTPQDSTLSLFDILLSIMMNSRLDTASKVQSIWKNKKPVEKALSHIPADVSLQDEHLSWENLETLFKAFCDIPWAGAAVSSKILHKKRPKLIPIYDSVIAIYINSCNAEAPLPRGSSKAAHMVWGMKCFRNLLLGSLEDIERLRGLPEMSRFPLSAVRVLEVLLWIENEGNGYYQVCPQCHSGKVIPITYGNPTPRLLRLAAALKIKLGGESRLPNRPRLHCTHCLNEWGEFR